MEVPGRFQDPDLQKGSQSDFSECCFPCENEGKHVPAHGFCETCNHNLCAVCFQVHTIPIPCKNHILLVKSTIAKTKNLKSKKAPVSNPCTIRCPDHHERIMEFFCSGHNKVECSVCAVLKHKLCSLAYIPDIAKGYEDSREYKNLVGKINGLQTDITALSADVRKNISTLPKSAETAIEELRKFKIEINEFLDKKEKELIKATRVFVNEDSSVLHSLVSEVDSLKAEISEITKQFKSTKQATSDLFVYCNRQLKDLDGLSERVTKCSEKNKTVRYSFKRGRVILNVLLSNAELGTVEGNHLAGSGKKMSYVDFQNVSIQSMPDVNDRMIDDGIRSEITGMTLLSADKLLLVDKKKQVIRKIKIKSNTALSHLVLPSEPWDVTALPKKQAAVTLPDKSKIQMISTKGGLSLGTTVDVVGNCLGISSAMDRLVVSFRNPVKIEVIDFNGKVHVRVDRDSTGSVLFQCPRYVSVIEYGRVPVICVSDYSTNIVTKLSLGGEVLDTHKHKNWDRLKGLIATEYGHLLVCNSKKQTVDVVSQDGKKVHTLLDKSHGIGSPRSLCYCAVNNILCVSNNIFDTPVKVFKLKRQ